MKAKLLHRRIIELAVMLVMIFAFYGLKLIDIQVVNGDAYEERTQTVYTRTQRVKAARGEIVDRYGQSLAVNINSYDIVFNKAFLEDGTINDTILRLASILLEAGEDWIDTLPITETAPFEFKEDSDAAIKSLKNFLGIEQYATVDDTIYWLKETFGLEDATDSQFRIIAGVRYEMNRRDFSMKNPYTFAKNVSIETVTRISESISSLSGVTVKNVPVRKYTNGTVASHIIGITGLISDDQLELLEEGYMMDDYVGKSGIEKVYESELHGEDGEQIVYINTDGEVINVEQSKTAVPGNTVRLTIDYGLNRVAQQALEDQITLLQSTDEPDKGSEATAGAVAVIDVKTGELLVNATAPSYSLSDYYSDYSDLVTDELRPLFNRVLNGAYAPGSTYKMVAATAALNEELITPYTTVNCEGVYTYFSAYQPTCMGIHGKVNVIDAIRVSCNIFFYEMGRLLGHETLNAYSEMYGFGQNTGIELPESIGVVAGPEYREKIGGDAWQAGDSVQSAIGQSDNLFTPIQLANYAATLANNGKRMKVSVVKSITSYNYDEIIYEHEPEVVYDLVEDGGVDPEIFETLREAMIRAAGQNGYLGTAHHEFDNYPITIAAKTGTPQTSSSPNAVFICYAPAYDPEIAIAVVIENAWHGYWAAPVAKAILNEYFFGSDSGASATDVLLK